MIKFSNITIAELKRIAAKKGYVIFDNNNVKTNRHLINYNLNIWGIRSLDKDTKRYNDTIIVFRESILPVNMDVGKNSNTLSRRVDVDNHRWIIDVFRATTDPSEANLLKPINPKGTAILKEGQYRGLFKKGLHKGSYQALVQNKPCTVIRDRNLDSNLDFTGREDTGMFGINLHRASKWSIVDTIGLYSAGCQVLMSVKDFEDILIPLVNGSINEGNNTFTYTLINEKDVRKEFI